MEIVAVQANQPLHHAQKHVACIGYFDGVHLGHQALIKKTMDLCDSETIPAIICFDQDPWVVMNKIKSARYITPHKERMRIFEQLGIQKVFLLHFDEAMMHLTKQQFIDTILKQLNLKAIVCGNDFRFAFQGEGNVHDLHNQGFHVEVVDTICFNHTKISSSTIEKNIEEGAIEDANKALNKAYSIFGVVVHGSHVGSTKLGFPTANLSLSDHYIIPKKGVYQGQVIVRNKTYDALINVGNNPTMNYQSNTSIEAHLLSFNEDIYHEQVTFTFMRYIRDEKKFNSIEELIAQLKEDVLFVEKNKRV